MILDGSRFFWLKSKPESKSVFKYIMSHHHNILLSYAKRTDMIDM